MPATPWAGGPKGLPAGGWGDEGDEGGVTPQANNWPSLSSYPSHMVSSHGPVQVQQQQQQQPQQQQQQQLQQGGMMVGPGGAVGGGMAPLLLSTESPRNSFNSMVAGSTHSILDQAGVSGMGSPMMRVQGGPTGQYQGPLPRSSPPTGRPPPSPGNLRPLHPMGGGVSQSQNLGSSRAGVDSQQWEEGGSDGSSGGGYAPRPESSLSMAGMTPGGGVKILNELEMQRRLKDTQALLSRFSEENGRLAKENDKLVRTRTVRLRV